MFAMVVLVALVLTASGERANKSLQFVFAIEKAKGLPVPAPASSKAPMTACDGTEAFPNGSDPNTTVEDCLRSCNGGDSTLCTVKCLKYKIFPGFICDGICRKGR
ncbi:hypothetical protein LEN26_003968 [Aphanomyces euteiches]|nr:hypothetical protein AeMF1_007614 [Aphanomyces euteiches]KAH9150933.1 hypothetical protein LEN26_003968 [Aphanomyces euteiches]KAH9180184.1 hypothetical protein AeNC1_017172 [Aphanomyces euteiches]